MNIKEGKMAEEMIEIFVVDGDLEIFPARVRKSDWKSKTGTCIAKIEGETEIVRRGQWNLLGSFAGFETRDEAELFKTTKMGG